MAAFNGGGVGGVGPQKFDEGITQVRSDIAGVKTDVSGVKTDVSGVKNDVAGVKTDTEQIKTDIAGIKSDVSSVNSAVENIPNELNQNFTEVNNSIDDLETLLVSQQYETVDFFTNPTVNKNLSGKVNSTYTTPDVSSVNSGDLIWETAVNITKPISLEQLNVGIEGHYYNSKHYSSFYRITMDDKVFTGYATCYTWSGSSAGSHTGTIAINFYGLKTKPLPVNSGALPTHINANPTRDTLANKSYTYYSEKTIRLNKLKIEFALGHSSKNSDYNQGSYTVNYTEL